MFRTVRAGAGLASALFLLAGCGQEPEPEMNELPDRFSRIVIEPAPSAEERPKEEGRLGAKERELRLLLGTRGAGVGGGGESAGVLGGVGGIGQTGAGYGSGGLAFRGGGEASDPVGPARGDTYVNPGVNSWVTTAEDPRSTFSVDVDSASWTRTRRQLRDGYLPQNAMVRVEEFVNYFPYAYGFREEGQPFSVHFEAAASPFHADRTLARIGLQARRISEEHRKPVHLTFLVDTSGSMSPVDKLTLVKESLTMLASELGDGDTVAIVTYAGGSRIVLEPTAATDTRRILAAIDQLASGGSTAMAKGVLTAYELADRSFVDGHVNRVIIASDGDANVGPVSPDDMVSLIARYAKKGITLTTLGYGVGNYRDHRMEQLANDGDGNYYYIDGRAEARRVLVDRMRSTLEVVARDVKLQVEWDPAVVASYRLVGYENRDIADADFRDDAVDAGEVGAGHQVTAVYELALVPGATAAPGALHLRWKAPGADAPAAEHRYPLSRSGLRPSLAETSRDTRLAVAAAWFAEVLRDSEHARDVSLDEVEALATSALRREYPEDAELVELIGTAKRLGGEGVALR